MTEKLNQQSKNTFSIVALIVVTFIVLTISGFFPLQWMLVIFVIWGLCALTVVVNVITFVLSKQ